MTNAISKSRLAATTSATPFELRSLEEIDNAVVGHFLDLNQCLIEYRQHGLSGTAIGKRVRELGADISDRSVRRRLQDFKMPKPVSDTADAVRMRNKRADEQTAKLAKCSPTDDSQSSTTQSLPENSDESSNTLDSKQVLQQKHGHEPERRAFRILQSDVDTDGEVREATVSIMDTPEQQQIDADWRDACEHLAALEQFTRKYFDPAKGLSERRYEELWQRCNSIAYFAHMRFANQRKEDEQCARQIVELVVRDECPELLEEGA